jgi:hypothetical protein
MKDYSMCRYYKGEKGSPYKEQNKSMLWYYEQVWINTGKEFDTSEYIAYGLKDFMSNDNVPITLKALLFNRYCKDCYSMASGVLEFEEFYHKYYS